MERKEIKELIKPYITVDLIVMVLISCVVMVLNLWMGVICLAAVLCVTAYHAKIASGMSVKQLAEMRSKIISENEEITRNFIDSCPVFMCVSDIEGNLQWSSENFREEITNEDSITGLLPAEELANLFNNEKYEYIADIKDSKYCVTASSKDESGISKRMLYFEDVTSSEIVRARFKNNRPCLAYINIDNYDELLSAGTVDTQGKLVADVDKIIRDWSEGLNGSCNRVASNRYMVFFEQKHVDDLRKSKFDIMEKVHGVETDADFPATISIGVGIEAQNFAMLEEYAFEAMDLAIGRGGDQAIIKRSGDELEYYGGSLATVERRNKGKSRILAHALMRLVSESDKILIMGHQQCDMDSFGAAIGMASLVSAAGKKAYIVLNQPNEAIDLLYDAAVETERFEFINDEIAMALTQNETLLVVLDTHIGPRTECPSLLEKCKKIVVIDHHRKSPNAIENTVLSYMEPYASSASEQVCELMQYAGNNLEFGKFEMDALLSGITLDTKSFTENAGARTFESASWLKRNGANSRNVNNFFKMRLDFFQKKVNMIASAEIIGNGIAVAYTKDTDESMQVLTAQAANELLEMRGIDVVFVAGALDEDLSTVSARSNGKTNVQVIMEKLGGGGHLNIAAAQLHERPEAAIQKVVELLREENLL